MEKQNGRKREEAPPRTYGVHWPSPPETPAADAPAPGKTAAASPAATPPVASPPAAKAPVAKAPAANAPAATAPVAKAPAAKAPAASAPVAKAPVAKAPAASSSTSVSPAPVIPPRPPAARIAAAETTTVTQPASAMPSAPPPAQPVQPVAQPVQPVAQPVQPVAQPVQPVAQPVQPVAQPVVYEQVFVPEPVDVLIPVPTGTPGLRVDPLTSPEIPVTPPVVAPPAEDTSGLSRREMRKLREQAAARIGEPSDSMSRIEDAAAMAAASSAVQSPYAATSQPAALAPTGFNPTSVTPTSVTPTGFNPTTLTPNAVTPTTVSPSSLPQAAPYVPLSTTLPGVPAAAAEMAAITGRLDIIETTRNPMAPTLPSGPTVAQLRAMEEASWAARARDLVLESTVPGTSTTGGVPVSGHSLIMSNVPTDVPSALSAMNETGEIIVTGQIVLPTGVAQMGTDMRRFDTAEIDVMSEQEPQTGNVGNLAPVSATRAVSAFSSHTTSSLPPRAGSHRLPMALALIAAGLAVAVVGVFVANIFLKFF